MIELFKSSEESKSFIDTYSDPFKSDKIESITMNISKEIFKPYAVQFYAHIRFKNGNTNGSHKIDADKLELIAKNDGLSVEDFKAWLNKPFLGQVLCWNENIEY